MKLVQSFVVAALVAVPALSFAQPVQPLTRAEVKAELVQLQKAGYNPAADNTQYPANLQAALARIGADNTANADNTASANGAADAAQASGYGGMAQGVSAAGARAASHGQDADVVGLGPIYAHS
ncbi:DUF4148 domain-containing protein [Paraburkholderia sp. J41]|uniref:DUF4148 domain-containing protein n=1 Tax=Paraburkholderia sp. J41 TaxID=2805433 RepID=UPI002AC32050|nr:DUF4148 domain-containing protein [Paraburkholderia sp. J41]